MVDASYDFRINSPYDFSIFIDLDDRNKIKCRNGRTGAIVASHDTHADIPFQHAIDQLSAGSALETTSGNFFYNRWTGGRYGMISVAPGIYNLYKGIVLKSYIIIQGSGRNYTWFKWPDGLLTGPNSPTGTSTIMFRSSAWDAGETFPGQYIGQDFGGRLRDFSIDGNKANNAIDPTDTAVTRLVNGIETAGFQSRGHGIAWLGYDLHCDNMWIKNNPGVGVIFQGMGGNFSNQGLFSNSRLINCDVDYNGRQGIVGRANGYIDRCNTEFNGEAGIDFQACQYFGNGATVISNSNSYFDGTNHGEVTSAIYDPFGFEMRLTGGNFWVDNMFIEGPRGFGDNLVLGETEGAPLNPTGWQIKGSGRSYVSNTRVDNPRYAGIRIGTTSVFNTIRCHLVGQNEISPPVGANRLATGILIIGGGNNIDVSAEAFNTYGVGSAITVGEKYRTPGSATWNNNIRLHSGDSQNLIDWQGTTGGGSNRGNTITIYTNSYSGGIVQGTQKIFRAGGAAFDYFMNTIDVKCAGPTAIKGSNGGSVTFRGTGSQSAFTITHLLFDVPKTVNVKPKNAAAAKAGIYYLTADATNITVNFTTAPSNGSLNQFWWDARVTP